MGLTSNLLQYKYLIYISFTVCSVVNFSLDERTRVQAAHILNWITQAMRTTDRWSHIWFDCIGKTTQI